MLGRRAFTSGLGGAALLSRARASTTRRLALLLGAPWPGETWLGNGVARMQEALRARGLASHETIASAEPLDRARLLGRIEEVRRRIAGWPDGALFLYYDGHGMYRRGADPVPEPGLQLTGNRDDPSSALLWREVWAALRAPAGVQLVLVPDCCHTNLLAGRLPPQVTALVLKSEPQDTLTCRTGSAFFGEGAARRRYGVISYYASGALAQAGTAGSWLSAIDRAAERDVAAGRLAAQRRPRLLVEGAVGAPLAGQPVGRAGAR